MPVSSSNHPGRGPSSGVSFARVSVPMRDEVRLNAAVYTPTHHASGVPTVLELTPYGVDGLHADGLLFASRGMAFLGVDLRGRGDSAGVFTPNIGDRSDGVDLIDWITRQPWSDGRVVLHGWSYVGQSCWMILGAAHPAVAAASISAPMVPAVDLPRNGVPTSILAGWRAGLVGRGTSYASNADAGLWAQEMADVLAAGLPVWSAAEAFGVPIDEHLSRYLYTPDAGPAWAGQDCSEDEIAAISVPVLAVGGAHDDCILGTFHQWSRYERLAPGASSASSHLLLGPWDHVGSLTGSCSVGDLRFDDAANVDLDDLRARWFRHVLFGDPEPGLLADRFVYYLAGAEEWRAAPSVESATSDHRELALRSLPGPHDVFHSGWLDSEPGDGPDYDVTLDPRDTRVLELELTPRQRSTGDGASPRYVDLMMAQAGSDPTSQFFSVTVDGDGVVYHSRPFDRECSVVGRPSLRLRAVCDADDADLLVLLHVVLPSGDAVFLSSDLLRLSRREGGGTIRRLSPGVEEDIDISTFRFTARVLPAGARVRLTVRSAWSTVSLPSGDGLRDHPAVHLRIVHSSAAPSVLRLPLGA